MSSPLVAKNSSIPAELIENRLQLLRTAEEVYNKNRFLIPIMQEYFNQFKNLGENINLYVTYELDPPEQALWNAKHGNLFNKIFPAIDKYLTFIPVLVKILALDQTGLYSRSILSHIIVLLIGEELTLRKIYSEKLVEEIGEIFLYFMDVAREFLRSRNACLRLLGEASSIDSRLLRASEERGAIAFLIQFIAVDLMDQGNNWRALFILARLEHHVARITGRTELAKRLEVFMKVVSDTIINNEKSAAAMKNKAKISAEEANLLAKKQADELLAAEEAEKAAAAEKSEKEKRKREEKAARKAAEAAAAAAEKAEADRVAAEAAAFKKAEAERIAAQKKSVKNSLKKSSNLLAASMKKRAPELMTPTRAILGPIKKATPAPSPPPPSVSPTPPPPAPPPSTSSFSPVSTPSMSPPTFVNGPRPSTPSLATIGFARYSPPPPVIRFWETLDHRYIYQILYELFVRSDNPDARFYLKGSAAVHLYKKALKLSISNHTSDYDTTLIINPGLPKPSFYALRSYLLDIIIKRLADAIDDPRFNAEVITKLHGAGIPFASFSYYDFTKREPVYTIQDKIPQEHISVPDKSAPKFYSDAVNQFSYVSYAAKPSTNILNLRILRALEKPKNVTLLQLYTKTSPEIKLIEVTIPFYEYDESETQISLDNQWKAAEHLNILNGIPILALIPLKTEQQKLRTLKDAAEIDRRLADIDTLISANARQTSKSRRHTRRRR